jgi:hypothetical protein
VAAAAAAGYPPGVVPARAVLALLVLLPCAAPAADPAEAQDGEPAVSCTCSEQCAAALGQGHVCREGTCTPYHDRYSFLDLIGLAREGAPTPPPMQLLPAVLPAVGYNPAMGLLVGVTGTLGMYLGPPAATTISSLQMVALVSTMSQVTLHASSTILTSGNLWQLHGDWRFLVFNQKTYGLGTGPTAMDAAPSRDDFQLVRVHENVLRKVVGALYLGAGYRLDRYYGVQDVGMNLDGPSPSVGPNYAYSLAFGFNPHEYTVSGLTLAALYDTRDSTISPYRGVYAAAAFTANPLWLGSTRTSTMLEAQARAYVPMSADVPRNVLAFWLYYHGVTSGIAPYLTLPAIGWEDYRNRTGRGYVQGRWRGTHELYGEVEWRFRITNDGLVGGVLFASVATFSAPAFESSGPGWSYASPRTNLLQYLRPAGGFGVRLLMNRDSRANVTVDLAWGESSFGLWLNAGEYF